MYTIASYHLAHALATTKRECLQVPLVLVNDLNKYSDSLTKHTVNIHAHNSKLIFGLFIRVVRGVQPCRIKCIFRKKATL